MHFSPGCGTMMSAQQLVNLCARHSPFDRGLPLPEHHEPLTAHAAMQLGVPIRLSAISVHRISSAGWVFPVCSKVAPQNQTDNPPERQNRYLFPAITVTIVNRVLVTTPPPLDSARFRQLSSKKGLNPSARGNPAK
jgi:hypothetical protein